MKNDRDFLAVSDIECVTVNGMKMWRLGSELYLSRGSAVRAVQRDRYNQAAMSIPYKQNDNIMKKISRGEVLLALVKF